MSEQFEELVTALANGSSRRTALRRLVVGAAAAVVASLPGLSAPQAASAEVSDKGKIGVNGALVNLIGNGASCTAVDQLKNNLAVNGTIYVNGTPYCP